MTGALDELGLTGLVTSITGISPVGGAAILAQTGDPGRLLAAAQATAPSLTREFVDKHKLSDDVLAAIARGEEPPPTVAATRTCTAPPAAGNRCRRT